MINIEDVYILFAVADTRVILEQPLDDENSDYINANYVNVTE